MAGQEVRTGSAHAVSPAAGSCLAGVVMRLAKPREVPRRDAMDAHHTLGIRHLTGGGLRHVVEWQGEWLLLAGGWPAGGAFNCAARPPEPLEAAGAIPAAPPGSQQHAVSGPTGPGGFPHLASLALTAMIHRLSADWKAVFGHALMVAETFVDPAQHTGTMYAAAGWTDLGATRGLARTGAPPTRTASRSGSG